MRWIWVPAALILFACSPLTKSALDKSFVKSETSFKDHIGFMVYDPTLHQVVYQHNASKYFTPASNIKILTFYTALSVLGDSIPAFRYDMQGDSLLIFGTGDPSFLNPNVFQNFRTYNFLNNAYGNVYLSTGMFTTEPFGPGWAWDDYNSAFSAERSAFPLYGNTFTVFKTAGNAMLRTNQPFFKKFIWLADSTEHVPRMVRDPSTMRTDYFPVKTTDSARWEIPFHTEPSLVAEILSDTLHRTVRLLPGNVRVSGRTFYSIPSDSIYRPMLQESDNFLAEQVLLLCAGVLSDSLNPQTAIRFMKTGVLPDLPDEPRWVDGSGLSRYNLVTPRDFVHIWNKLYETIPNERLFSLLASNGGSGTLKNWFNGEQPFIYGKTGTLSNNHSLSGYLVTKQGKVLIFSFMNSNYVTPVREVRKFMEQILLAIRDNYRK